MLCSATIGRISQAQSLFYYHDGGSYNTFNTPSFTPAFGLAPLAADPVLNATAAEICGDDYSCLFDIATTGSSAVGRSTHEIMQHNEQMKEDLG